MEVAAEYPHNEIKNEGINHFPDGVFQKCRTIIVKEREIEREKIRKSKRMKKEQNKLRSKSNISTIVPLNNDNLFNDSDSISSSTIRSTKSAPVLSTDPFDIAWSQTLHGRSIYNVLNENENDAEDNNDDSYTL